MIRPRAIGLALTGAWVTLLACRASPGPEWPSQFNYPPAALHAFRINGFGFPAIPAVVAGDTTWLPFDTGNMAGLTLQESWFEDHQVECDSTSIRRDSGGAPVSEGCLTFLPDVQILGGRWDSIRALGFAHPSLPGLVGPGQIPGTRFTLDYSARRMAVDSGSSPAVVAGFESLPLVVSPRHPRLVLVWGTVNGRRVLIELDTGKSRTTVDRELVRELAMPSDESGARVGTVEIGPWRFEVASARVVNTSGISVGLPAPISVGVGSDQLSRFIWTVDYPAGRIWLETANP